MLHLMIKARSDFTHVISEIWFVVLAYIAYQLTRCDGFGFALAWKGGGVENYYCVPKITQFKLGMREGIGK